MIKDLREILPYTVWGFIGIFSAMPAAINGGWWVIVPITVCPAVYLFGTLTCYYRGEIKVREKNLRDWKADRRGY